MPLLIVQESGHPPRLFEVRQPKLTIGRAPESDLLLANVSISRTHAVLETRTNGLARVTPQASHNPVLVNDEPIAEPAMLQTGDSFRLGKYKLTWLHEDQLDMYKIQQLAELPRFNRAGGDDDHATHALPAGLQQKLIQVEMLREYGALTPDGGEPHVLGTDPVNIGPDDAIACGSRWGRRTAATVAWAGSGHEIKSVGMFAKVSVNGASVTARTLAQGDTVEVNGTTFSYGRAKKRRR